MNRHETPLPELLVELAGIKLPDGCRPTAAAIALTIHADDAAGEGEAHLIEPFPVDFKNMVIGELHRRDLIAKREKRDARIIDLIVAAVEAGADGGELVASALHKAANSLPRPWYLVIGRPGSWEAAIVMRMADEGGSVTDGEALAELTDLFTDIGESRNQGEPEDGGATLSYILGTAADRLGSIPRLTGRAWAYDVDNLAMQYASEEVQQTSRYRA